ncbi:MAG: trans-sulfuration enzyme family protein [Phycisphaerae bacterium]
MRPATQAVHVGQKPDPTTGATVPPIYTTSTYTQASPGSDKGFDYSRSINPTRVNLEEVLSSLEGGRGCATFASGMAATTALLHTLRPGQKVVAYSDLYGGTYRVLEEVFRPWGLESVYTDDTDPQAFARLVDDRTKLVWLETPTNPLLRVLDIRAIAEIAHQVGATLAVDNTFATPALQKPIELGADFVVHSTTKYVGGHSDIIGGAVVAARAELIEPINFYRNSTGAVPGPFDCYLTHRGIKTLPLRMERHSLNAFQIAEHLTGHKNLEKVIYPLLPDHPDRELAGRQMSSGGGIVSLVVKGGQEGAFRFCERTQVFALAESLGGVESLVNHPAIMTHGSIPKEIREARGVTDGLVRLSVGIEAIEDLIEDLEQALAF